VARCRGLIAKMEAGLPTAESNAARAELIMLHVLADLDQVVRAVLSFCDKPGAKDDQLSKIRAALRIGRGSSPYDTELRRQQSTAVKHWIAAYNHMQKTAAYQSERTIASQIAKVMGIGTRTVTRYWQQLKKREPWQAKWAKQIAQSARSAEATLAFKNRQLPNSGRKNKKAKRRQQRIKFGH
jgi:hypothetical protein